MLVDSQIVHRVFCCVKFQYTKNVILVDFFFFCPLCAAFKNYLVDSFFPRRFELPRFYTETEKIEKLFTRQTKYRPTLDLLPERVPEIVRAFSLCPRDHSYTEKKIVAVKPNSFARNLEQGNIFFIFFYVS